MFFFNPSLVFSVKSGDFTTVLLKGFHVGKQSCPGLDSEHNGPCTEEVTGV